MFVYVYVCVLHVRVACGVQAVLMSHLLTFHPLFTPYHRLSLRNHELVRAYWPLMSYLREIEARCGTLEVDKGKLLQERQELTEKVCAVCVSMHACMRVHACMPVLNKP